MHHGNGTQDIFWDDPTVLFVSTHQFPAYPGTGRADETGGATRPGSRSTSRCPRAPPATSPWPRSTTWWRPRSTRFAPTWVLISAGFDAHRADPLADLAWSAGDYAALAARVREWSPAPGRTIAFLEGGYDLAALRASVGATASVLAGTDVVLPSGEGPTAGGPGRDVVDRIRRTRTD